MCRWMLSAMQPPFTVMVTKPKQPGHEGRPGEAHHFARLTEKDVKAIRQAAKTRKRVDIAKEYGITDKHCCDIVLRKRWRHI